MVIKYHDDSLVPINDNTRDVKLIKSTDKESVYKFELNENGTVAVKIPTKTNETDVFSIQVTSN